MTDGGYLRAEEIMRTGIHTESSILMREGEAYGASGAAVGRNTPVVVRRET